MELHHGYTYQGALAASEKVHWRVEDLIGGEKKLDFDKPFLPESLARVGGLSFLDADQQRTLNQVRGQTYLYVFGFVEEFILPFVLDHARLQLGADDYHVRALLGFGSEEAKHIHLFKLFKRFREEFHNGFGSSCDVIGPASEVARAVLAHHPVAVALIILHIEWMTQGHYIESVRDDGDLDSQFKSLLRHHWMEEAQHAKLDTLMIQAFSEVCSVEEIDRAIDEYLEIGGLLDGGLTGQAEFDVESFVRVSGARLAKSEHEQLVDVQRQATRWTFLGSGMLHPRFLETVGALRQAGRTRIENEIAPIFC